MTTLTAYRPPDQRSLLDCDEEPLGASEHRPEHRPTLDDVLSGAWDALAAAHAASCPVCGDELTPRYGAGARPVAATCRGCGSQLS